MNIKLENVLPIPLTSMVHSENSIWSNKIELFTGQKVITDAFSGKGKSTLISLLFGVRNDYNGIICFDNHNIASFTINEWTQLRKNKISAVFQDLQLFPNLSVKDNLLLKNQLTNIYSEKEIAQLIDRVGLKDKWEQKCGNLSMGQQQRVAIIRSLLQPFEWLFLDEPFSHLDKVNTTICLELLLEKANSNNSGVVLTTLGEDYAMEWDQHLYL
jgi:ABC-type lipoprotein export system ATPase subunit